MNMSTPPGGRGSLPPGDRNPRRRRLPAGAYAVLLPLAFVGFYLGLKKAFGDADMAGAQMLRLVVFIPAMAALMTGCLPLLAGPVRRADVGSALLEDLLRAAAVGPDVAARILLAGFRHPLHVNGTDAPASTRGHMPLNRCV